MEFVEKREDAYVFGPLGILVGLAENKLPYRRETERSSVTLQSPAVVGEGGAFDQ